MTEVILERYADELGPLASADQENTAQSNNSEKKETTIDIGKVAFTLVESGRKSSLGSLLPFIFLICLHALLLFRISLLG